MSATALTIAQWKALTTMQNAEEYYPNGLKVSKTDNPMYFPVEYTYQVGSAEILALMSNTIAVGTGQTGAAPLYVFCKDGVYALFVDASGEMVYTNARVIARDVCNNARSVTPTDAGVVFTTDRGLMMIAGEQVEEIGEPAEGDVLRYIDDAAATGVFTPRNIVKRLLNVVAELPLSLNDGVDFLTYIKGCIVNYNHNLRELIISNPNYSYSYILDAGNNWKRYSNSAEQYVNNFPTSYRVRAGRWYKVDQEEEHLDEADNKVFVLSNIIKLGTIGFKQAYRFVTRGYFETMPRPIGTGVFSGHNVYYESDDFANYEIGDELNSFYFSFGQNGFAIYKTAVSDAYASNVRIFDSETKQDITDALASQFTPGGKYLMNEKLTISGMPMRLGCYVFGSHDGRQWELLGGNERTGTFTDLGCTVHRTDVKFYRFAIAGQLLAKSRLDFLEMSATGTRLGGKIR